MFLDKKGKFLIIFIAMLILSITPASAVLIGEGYGNVTNTSSQDVLAGELVDDETLKSVDKNSDDLQKIIDVVNGDLDYIQKRSKDYNWKVWKWPKITSDIVKRAGILISTLPDLKAPIDKLGGNLNKLQNSSNEIKIESSADNDANKMAKILSKKFQTNVTVETVKASELKEGDIVQYMSQGKYPRYLEVVNIINNTKTIKQNENATHAFTPVIQTPLAQAPNNWEVEITGNIKRLKISGLVDPGIVTSYSASVQESAENNSQKEISSYNTRAGTCLTWATILTVLTGALFTAGFLGVFLAPVTAGTSLVLTSLDSFCVFTVVGFIIGFSLYGIFHDLANNLKNKFKDNKEDLDRYTKPIKVTNMDVDTYDGIPILNQTTIPDYKSYQFLLIDPSEHGDVLPGPGIQFLYGPNDGFTGNDTFKFEYSQNGKPVGIMIVNILIKPLPMFNITPEVKSWV